MLSFPEYKEIDRVLFYFEEISKIPHGSGNTDKIAEYLTEFAKEHGLFAKRDSINNVTIKKLGTVGYENHSPIILQGHLDMVIAKTDDCKKDLLNEGISILREGDFLRADGTTLGADDGVAIAYALALLESDDIPHPPLEVILTSDEEIGLIGAIGFDASHIEGHTLINIDNGGEGVFTVGCAGGLHVEISLPMYKADTEAKNTQISIFGLIGGHSGAEIHKCRENAIKILGEVLCEVCKATPVRLYSIVGGDADNAIPQSAKAIVQVPDEKLDTVSRILTSVCNKYREIEPNIDFSIKNTGVGKAYTEEDTKKLISLICELPNGVIAMSEDIKGLVETSLNLGIINTETDRISLAILLRSSKDTEKRILAKRVCAVATSRGARLTESGEHPGWDIKKNSAIRDIMKNTYKKLYGKDVIIEATHAGLECGIFFDKIENLDCISIGADTLDAHTVKERLSLPSFSRMWLFLKEVLSAL